MDVFVIDSVSTCMSTAATSNGHEIYIEHGLGHGYRSTFCPLIFFTSCLKLYFLYDLRRCRIHSSII